MGDLGQAQTGQKTSMPKSVKVMADDNLKVIYRNLGNNHSYPFVWGDTVTMSGTEVVLASGVKLHGMDLASYGNVVVTPLASVGANTYYVEKDTANNIVTLKSTGALSNVDFDVQVMLGAASSSRYIEAIYCRGNNGAQQSLP